MRLKGCERRNDTASNHSLMHLGETGKDRVLRDGTAVVDVELNLR